MIEDEEAVDYGEDELSAPVSVQEEVSLMMKEGATRAEPAVAEVAAEEEADVAVETPLEEPIESGDTTGGDEDDGTAQVKAQPTSTTKQEKKESPAAADNRDSRKKRADATDSTAGDRDSGSRGGENRKRDDKDQLPRGWITIQSRSGNGEVYYYNEDTGESSWTKPTTARESRKSALSDAKPASSANADQSRSKKKKEG